MQPGIGLDTAAKSAFGAPWAKADRQCMEEGLDTRVERSLD